MTKRKRRARKETPIEAANRRELDARIAGITAELEAAGSAYVAVRQDDQLAYAIGRIDAELRSGPGDASIGVTS